MGSIHSGHVDQSSIVNKTQFNEDYATCKIIRDQMEQSITNDINRIKSVEKAGRDATERSVANTSIQWDISANSSAIEPNKAYTTSDIPSIQRTESDTFATIMTKLLTRSLRFRLERLSIPNKRIVMASLGEDTEEESPVSSIVMQMVSVLLSKAEQGQLWSSKEKTEARRMEEEWDLEERNKAYIRNLDHNLLMCDDESILVKILTKQIYDITAVDFSLYFRKQDMQIENTYLGDTREVVLKTCKECGNPEMYKKSIREFIPLCTHDEIWRNKDSVDFLMEYSCPKCGYTFQSETLMDSNKYGINYKHVAEVISKGQGGVFTMVEEIYSEKTISENEQFIIRFLIDECQYTMKFSVRNQKADGTILIENNKGERVVSIQYNSGVLINQITLYIGNTKHYRGELSKGVPNGIGKEYENNHVVYRGTFLNGKRHGYGQEYSPSKEILYCGLYKENKQYKKCEQIAENKYVFRNPSDEVEYVSNYNHTTIELCDFKYLYSRSRILSFYIIDAKSTYILAKSFSSTEMTEYRNNKVIYKGGYFNSVEYDYMRHGKGVLFDENDRKLYEGEFAFGMKEGNGILYDASTNTVRYEGEWKNDCANGHGVLCVNEKRIEGEWIDNYHWIGNSSFIDVISGIITENEEEEEKEERVETRGCMCRRQSVLSSRQSLRRSKRLIKKYVYVPRVISHAEEASIEVEVQRLIMEMNERNVPRVDSLYHLKTKSHNIFFLSFTDYSCNSMHDALLSFLPFSHLKSISIGDHCLTVLTSISLSTLPYLRLFSVGSYSCTKVTTLELVGHPSLEEIVIGSHSFSYTISCSFLNLPCVQLITIKDRCFSCRSSSYLYKNEDVLIRLSRKALTIKKCPLLRSIEIEALAFSDYSVCVFQDLPLLSFIQIGNVYEDECYNFWLCEYFQLANFPSLGNVIIGGSSFSCVKSIVFDNLVSLEVLNLGVDALCGDTDTTNTNRVIWRALPRLRMINSTHDIPSLSLSSIANAIMEDIPNLSKESIGLMQSTSFRDVCNLKCKNASGIKQFIRASMKNKKRRN